MTFFEITLGINRKPRTVTMCGVASAILAAHLIMGIGGTARAQLQVQQQTPQQTTRALQQTDSEEIHILPVQGQVYMLAGAGGNITVQTGKDGVLLVDAGLLRMSDKVMGAVRKISDGPVRYIINTHAHADHTGGNENLAKQGSTIIDNNFMADVAGPSVIPGAKIISHQSVLDWLSVPHGNQPAARSAAWPIDTFITREKDLFFNGEAVVLYHEPAAHTEGDVIAFFRRSDVISTGDIFTPDTYPFIDLERGGGVQGLIAALNHTIELAVPADKQEGGTYVVPGHGRLCDEADVVEYQTMVTIVRDRIEDFVKKGMTLEQVKAARPTLDYDPHYNARTGPGTTDRFVEAVYKSLTKQ